MAKLNFVKREIIHKGWSKDQKYCVTDEKGGKYLLRISPADQFEQKKFEFEMMEKIAALHVPMCKPIKFGTCDEGVYSIQSWVEGQDAQEVIPTVSDTEADV